MDIQNLSQAPVKLSKQPNNTSNILDSLRRLGGIDATVVRISKGEVLLSTRLGEIIGKNVLDLKAGQQVRIRVGGQDSNPVLKLNLLSAERILLNASRETALSRALTPNRPQAAMVVTQRSEFTAIALNNGSQYSITRQSELKTGQLISLTYRPDKSQIEVKPANTEKILKSALTRMLPQVMQAGSGDSLVSLVKALQALVARSPTADGNISIDTRASQSGQSSRQSTSVGPNSNTPGTATAQNAVLSGQGKAPAQFVSRFLSMVQSLPDISSLDKVMLQQWAGLNGSIKNNHRAGVSILENPFSLLKQLPTNEAALRPLLQQLASHISTSLQLKNNAASNTELSYSEAYSSVAKDILKLVEQSLTQHQFQQTNIRYQQKQQQPLNLSVTIPVTENQSTKPLHVEIREKKLSPDGEDDLWDIKLSFEFGLLGLISSHIILHGNTLSTTFWASEESTKIKIDQALPEFQQQLVASGFALGQFLVLAGPAPATNTQERPSYPDALLDIRV